MTSTWVSAAVAGSRGGAHGSVGLPRELENLVIGVAGAVPPWSAERLGFRHPPRRPGHTRQNDRFSLAPRRAFPRNSDPEPGPPGAHLTGHRLRASASRRAPLARLLRADRLQHRYARPRPARRRVSRGPDVLHLRGRHDRIADSEGTFEAQRRNWIRPHDRAGRPLVDRPRQERWAALLRFHPPQRDRTSYQ